MKYEILKNGKVRNITIPDIEITRSMKAYNLNKSQAIKMWLEDNEIEMNEEQERLVQETKGVKLYAKGESPRKKRTVTKKIDEDKITLINLLNDCLSNQVDNLTVTNNQKIIEFDYNGNHYKLDLIKQRRPKD